MDAVPAGDFGNPAARALQAEFTIKTAQVAIDEEIAVFMPFMLTAKKQGGHEMVLGPDQTYPAWDRYSEFTKTYQLRNPPLSVPPEFPNRIVTQWLPDYTTCIPHKVSGSYWSEPGNNQVTGTIQIYNFSSEEVSGHLRIQTLLSVILGDERSVDKTSEQTTIAPMSSASISVAFDVPESGYFNNQVQIIFSPRGSVNPSHQKSLASFRIEARPTSAVLPFTMEIAAIPPAANNTVAGFQSLWPEKPYSITSRSGSWLGINGVVIASQSECSQNINGVDSLSGDFSLSESSRVFDKISPPVAVTRVNGLPTAKNAFLRIRGNSATSTRFRLDLVDDKGQRFSIPEWFGMNRFSPTPNEILLSYDDFHLHSFGRSTEKPFFDPSAIREIQLRFYMISKAKPATVELDVVANQRQ
jgi:hypothetical protein